MVGPARRAAHNSGATANAHPENGTGTDIPCARSVFRRLAPLCPVSRTRAAETLQRERKNTNKNTNIIVVLLKKQHAGQHTSTFKCN